MKKWYAVQENREDEWGYGSFDPAEAIDMLRAYRLDGKWDSLIAVIENDVCIDEIIPDTDTVDQTVNDVDDFAATLARNGWDASDRDEIAIQYQLGTDAVNAIIAAMKKAGK